ncbi:hypothetical protein NEMBOFW57_005264 [Staphylotrichum longicolle]|uniref:Mmc1 C-terminal domain-containing protein n=1 Tax=Staphylotrichum longicolle TaxID=669026 RepID=A0AAD4HVW8_9PEZI|nr:hypothetical protein NEMBOFW57_005264 [Staphylotrichum longicolle]
MPPALALQRALARTRRLPTPLTTPSICLFCSFSPSLRPRSSSSLRRKLPQPQRLQSRAQSTTTTTTTTTPTPSAPPSDPPIDLQRALLSLQTHHPNYVNLPRLQLALRNLSEPPGRESVRVAFLSTGAANSGPGSTSTQATTKQLLRLALADPLRPADAWEARLAAHDLGAHALIVRVGAAAGRTGGGVVAGSVQGHEEGGEGGWVGKEHVIPELRVSSPLLNGGDLEMLVADAGAAVDAAAAVAAVAGGRQGAVDDAVLVPTVDVAATTAGHVAAVGTPVHMALLVGEGVRGAASILSLPLVEGREVIAGAVNFRGVGKEDLVDCPVVGVNVEAGREGLELFRADVKNAIKYETLWSEANVSRITEWLRKSALPSGEGTMKPPVRNLIDSLLRNARAAIQEEEARDLSAELHTKVSPGAVAHLDQALADWAQGAHQELQQQLDAAFTTRPWSKLGWWKLFWRADDVGMVTSEMVALRFLPRSEQGLIYLSGRIQEAGVVEGQRGQPLYTGPALPQPSPGAHRPDTVAATSVSNWPTHIPFTRSYLQDKTVPALQALAQKLVVQSASLAGLSTALPGLSYLSALGAYECGAIAALGIALSFRRLQQKWDAAREYWEGEVREEGRKAIRATEASVAEVLDRAGKTPDPQADMTAQLAELRKVEELITRAEEALTRVK